MPILKEAIENSNFEGQIILLITENCVYIFHTGTPELVLKRI